MAPVHCLVQPRRVDIHKVLAKASAGASVLFCFVFVWEEAGRARGLVPTGLLGLTSACSLLAARKGVSDAFP